MINRTLEVNIKNLLFKGKAILLSGPRQVGKTTLMKNILSGYSNEVLELDGDDPTVQTLLNRPNTEQLKQLIAQNRIVFIDEAQRMNEIGLTSKIICDRIKDVQLILSGSSSFDLHNKLEEPLTGRKFTFNLWPVTFEEWQQHTGYLKAEQDLENRLVFGLYPEVLTNPKNPNLILNELADSYLYKDILMFEGLKKPAIIRKLVQALAYQIGNEVSLRELSQTVGADSKTVNSYIDILEKAYIVFRLTPLSRNLRNEIKSKNKIYFYDNGIRNAVIGQLQPLAIRQDIGALWENFLISERIKQLSIHKARNNYYFWRSSQQQEVDYIEERESKFHGYEFKWNENKKVRFPKTFTNAYNSANTVIHRSNFRDFVM